MLLTRPDGVRIRDLGPMRRLMPHLMPGRNESLVFYEQIVDATRLIELVEASSRPGAVRVTPLHVVVASLGRVLRARPQLDRFVAGGTLWQRKVPSVAFAAKREFADDSPLKTIKLPVVEGESLTETATRIHDAVGAGRTRDDRPVDRELALLDHLPDFALRPLARGLRLLDRWNLLPNALIADDPLYSSVFVANLGSLGIDRAWHHLYEHGTVSLFCVIGALRPRVVPVDGGSAVRPTLRLRFTLDERVCDGYYAAQSLELLRGDLEDPARMSQPLPSNPPRAINAPRSTL